MNRPAVGKDALATVKKILPSVFFSLFAVFLLLRFTPYPALKRFLDQPMSPRIYDRSGVLLQIVPVENGIRREYVSLNELRPEIARVFIAAEDKRFYAHCGIDPIAVVRAALQNAASGRRVSGASTITMQLARIIASKSSFDYFPYDSPVARKIAEAVNALRLETRFSKDEILELYLNSIPFGFQTEGIASAARNFFSTETAMLSPAQIFCLAVIPRRPGAYNPLQNPAACAGAAKLLQKRFSPPNTAQKRLHTSASSSSTLAALTDSDWDYALKQARRFNYPFEAPHLVRHVLENAGFPTIKNYADISLTIDIYLQHYIEGLIAANTSRYAPARLNQGAAIVIDNADGAILAWAGSADFSGENGGQIDGTRALNQPGSSMKPFLYALALERGFKPSAVLADIPSSFGGEEVYIPQNFNNRFNGPVLLRQALASSLNIPAVELLHRLGVRDYAAFLLSLGFDSLSESAEDAGLGLALGNAPVSLSELARAFSVFPNDGLLLNLHYTRGETASQQARRETLRRVISQDTARIICSFLSDKDARYLAFGRARNFSADFPLIVKTGTANQYQSIVALAASRRFTGAMWMGNFTGETVIGKTGSSIPAAMARDSLAFLHKNFTPEAGTAGFEEPENFIKTPVCAASGLSPAPSCPVTLLEYAESPPPPCDWHRNEGGLLFTSYPAEYESWLAAYGRSGAAEHAESELAIVTPRDNFVFLGANIPNQSVPVEVIGGVFDELRVLYDGKESVIPRPFKFFLPLERGTHSLIVSCGGESREVTFTVDP